MDGKMPQVGLGARPEVDVGRLIDGHGWSPFQIFVVLAAASAVLFDGLDNQSLGFSLPSIMAEWKLPKSAFAPALAVGQLGMMLGTVAGGLAGDRFGRKAALIGSVLLFGICTMAIAGVNAIVPLAALRLVAGFGLGGTLPNAAALVAEFTPARHRSLAVTAGIVCVPLGGVIGGFVAASVLPAYGWRTMFVLVGGLPLAASLGLMLALPESLRFLARRQSNWRRIAHLLARMNIATPPGAAFHDAAPAATASQAPSAILSRDFRRDTLHLWAAFFFCLTAIYAAFGWLPTLLSESGFDVAAASHGLAAFNAGGVVAALTGGWMIGRFGSRRPLLVLCSAAVVSGLLIALFPVRPDAVHYRLYAALAIEGGCVNGVQTTLYALAAHVYPTGSRSTGIGAAAGIGRIGAILSSFLGAAVIALGHAAGFHALIAATMLVVAVALLRVRRHEPAHQS